MPEFKFKPEHEIVLNQMMAAIPDVIPGKMFGYPGYQVNGKLAVGLFDYGIVLKLGAARVKTLVGQNHIESFEPMPGRPWKDWVLLTGDFEANQALFAEAADYVRRETGG